MRRCLTSERHLSSPPRSIFLAGHAPFLPDITCAWAVLFQSAPAPVQCGASGLFSMAATILQSGFTCLLKTKCPLANLLITDLIFQGHLPMVLSATNTFFGDSNTFFLCRLPSLPHGPSASRKLSEIEISMSIIYLEPVVQLFFWVYMIFFANIWHTPDTGQVFPYRLCFELWTIYTVSVRQKGCHSFCLIAAHPFFYLWPCHSTSSRCFAYADLPDEVCLDILTFFLYAYLLPLLHSNTPTMNDSFLFLCLS